MLKILLRQHWILVGLSCFLVLFAVFVYDAHREPTTTRYIKTIISPADLEQLEAIKTVPSDSENGLSLLLEAADKIQYPQEERYISISFKFGESLPSEQQEMLRKYVDMNDESLSLILEALEYPYIHLPPLRPYDQHRDEVYDKTGELIRFLSYRMLGAATRNESVLLDEAITTNRQFLKKLSYSHYLQDEMVKQSMLTGNVYYMETLLSYATPSLTTIREHLTLFSINEQKSFDNARMALINETIKLSPSHELNSEFLQIFHKQSDVMRLLGMASMEWSQLPFIGASVFTERLAQTLAIGSEDIYTAAMLYGREQEKEKYALSDLFYPYGLMYPDIFFFAVRHIARLNGARSALASLLFHYDHNRMPDTLEELVPDYLDALPRDPFTPNRPIRYRIDGDIALFYSIGENAMDNNGVKRIYNSQKNAYDHPERDDIIFWLKVPQITTERQEP